MTVSELAGEVGISADTVRYYERIGLLPEPERSPSGYRLYRQQDVERAKFVKRAQRLGLRLADIGGLADVWDRGLCPCGGTRRLLEVRLSELDADLTALTRLRQEICGLLDEDPTNGGSEDTCGPLCITGSEQVTPTPASYPLRLRDTRRNDMTMTNTCSCGTPAASAAQVAAEPCSCGCCGPQPAITREQRVAELRALRESIERELTLLESP